MRAFLQGLGTLLLAAAVTCGGSDVVERSPPTMPLSSFRTANVEIHVHDTRAQPADVMRLHAAVVKALAQAQVFTKVSDANDRSRTDLTLRITLLTFDRGAEGLLNEGHLALKVGVELLDNARGRHVGVFEVAASSKELSPRQGIHVNLDIDDDRTGRGLGRLALGIASYVDDHADGR